MKKLLLLSALAVVLVVPAQALAANITVSATGFAPASLTINQGDTVTWTNPDSATHQVMSRKAGFSSPPAGPQTRRRFRSVPARCWAKLRS